jgi:WD40 repeat protein
MKKLLKITLLATLCAPGVLNAAAVELKAGKAAAAAAQQAAQEQKAAVAEQKVATQEQKQFSAATYAQLPRKIHEKVEGEFNADKKHMPSSLKLYEQTHNVRFHDSQDMIVLIKYLSLSRDGNCVVIASNDGMVRILERQSSDQWAIVHTESHCNDFVEGFASGGATAIAISDDGNWIATGSFDGHTRILKRQANGQWILAFKYRHQEEVKDVAINRDGSKVIATSTFSKACIFERQNNNRWTASHIERHGPLNPTRVAISGDWNRIVTISLGDTIAYIIERQADGRWALVHTIIHDDEIFSVSISNDGNRIVTGSRNHKIRIIDRQADGQWLVAHIEHGSDSAKISSDGTRVITRSWGGTVSIIERQADGRWTADLEPYHGSNSAISGDGLCFVSSSGDYPYDCIRITKRAINPQIKIDLAAVQTSYNILGLTPAQYCLINNLHTAYNFGIRKPISLSADQLGVFKTLPTALRMFIKHKYNLTTEAIAKAILDKRNGKQDDARVAAREGKEEKKAGAPQQAQGPQPAAAAVAIAKATASQQKS